MIEDMRDAPAGPIVARQGVFTPQELDAIEAYGESLRPLRAEIAGRKDNIDRLRISRTAWMERNSQTEWLYGRIEQTVLDLNARFFKYELYGLIEFFQYTVYEGAEGGHYNWHVDTGPLTREPRKFSITLQLSDASAYEGGELVLEAGEGPFRAQKARGTLVAFPSYVMHRVMPVTAGVRKSLVIWVSGPSFR